MRKSQAKKWELRSIVKVKATNDFRIICTFDNKEIKEFDMGPLLKKRGPMSDPLLKRTFFKKVFLEMGVPTWPNGFDVCADLIYQEGRAVAKRSMAA